MMASAAISALAPEIVSLRVVPPVPAGRSPFVGDEPDSSFVSERDDLAGFATFIVYDNGKGIISQRRITCHRVEGSGTPSILVAYCHERRQPRSFRIDRISEMIDLATGEVVDPVRHLNRLREFGLITMRDKLLEHLAIVLVFLARCDGEYHPFEAEAIERAFAGYMLRYGGDDAACETLMADCRALAPDGRDAMNALDKLLSAPQAPQIAALICNAMETVVSADGELRDNEVIWGIELGAILREASLQ